MSGTFVYSPSAMEDTDKQVVKQEQTVDQVRLQISATRDFRLQFTDFLFLSMYRISTQDYRSSTPSIYSQMEAITAKQKQTMKEAGGTR